MELARRELTERIEDMNWCADVFPEMCACDGELVGVYPINGKYVVPCGEVGVRKYKLAMWSLVWTVLVLFLIGAAKPCLVPSVPALGTLIGFVVLLPCIVLAMLICCGNEPGMPMAFGPCDSSVLGVCRPVVCWNLCVIFAFSTGFLLTTLPDVFIYECIGGKTDENKGAFLSLIHISEPTRLLSISYAVFCLKKKKTR
eukprot:TRINITY_DN23709_c0_g1_i3.p2 TRINITY_DN23709_c0_g1~~TRINITY_DN23709_c0_g1_i3.p2  ORF type:complete len:199 (+),score=36.26 TRINITY_DN23709_c0_g1_i3:215-811(+)